jgi:hypothetical protein
MNGYVLMIAISVGIWLEWDAKRLNGAESALPTKGWGICIITTGFCKGSNAHLWIEIVLFV